MVDLDGARSGSPSSLDILSRVAAATKLTIDYGGDIRNDVDLAATFDAGASMVNLGSIAVREPETLDGWIEKFGGERFLIGADSRSGNAAIDGWKTSTAFPVIDIIRRYGERGVHGFFVTEIARDGAMTGPAVDLYKDLMSALPGVKIIASGGVRSIEDVDELERIGCAGVIIGRALYEGRIRLEDLARYAS